MYNLTSGHNADDLPICLTHAISSQTAYIMDRILYSFGKDTIPSVKLLSSLIHLPSKDTGFYGRSDFGRTRRFSAVADNAGDDSQSIN